MDKQLICFGEVLLRVASWPQMPFGHGNDAQLYLGGSELNLAITARSLGLNTDWVSLLPNTDLGRWVRNEIRKQGLATEYVEFFDHSMAVYFLEQGADPRPPKVLERIKGPLSASNRPPFDWVRILKHAFHFHTTGISAGLSDLTFQDVALGLEEAKHQGLTTSYDFNYRARLWPLHTAKMQQGKLLNAIDILFGGMDDLMLMLDIPLDDPTADQQDWQRIHQQLFGHFPFQQVVLSQRAWIEGQDHYRVVGFKADAYALSPWHPLSHVDRIGTGDAMAAGFLWGRYRGASFETAVQRAAACGALKDSLPGDFYPLTPVDLERWLDSYGHWR